jgi:antitoxin component of RelBE/YafQ-DinJ toxin-antitoxin module
MDAKVTLSFDGEVIERAKHLCDDLGISLSRFTEIVYQKALEFGRPASIEELPISEWVNAVAEDRATYGSQNRTRSRADTKKAFFESRKK